MLANEASRAAAFASQADKSRALAAGHVEQAIAVAKQIAELRAAIALQLSQISIPHRWNGTRLELQGADGVWVTGPDLIGQGNVDGPDASVNGNIVLFQGNTGQEIKDSGKSLADFATADHTHTKADIGLGNVADIAPADMPVSTAQQAAINTAIAALVGIAPDALNTFAEVAAALQNDEDFGAQVVAQLAEKLVKSANLSDLTDKAAAFAQIKQAATTSATGVVQRATDAEALAGTAQNKIPDVKQTKDMINAAPSGKILISTHNVSTAVAAVNIALTGTFKRYLIEFEGVVPSIDGDSLWLRTSTDGLAYDSGASDYTHVTERQGSGTGTIAPSNGDTSQVAVTSAIGNDVNEVGASGSIDLARPGDAAYCVGFLEARYVDATGLLFRQSTGFRRNAAADVSHARLIASSGNIKAGATIRLYGAG